MEKNKDDLHDSIARFAIENSSLRRSAKRSYERMRLLEDSIRLHVSGQCDCTNQTTCMFKLGHLVPINPRPKYGVRKKIKQ